MKRYFTFMFVGMVFALVGEFMFKFFAQPSMEVFWGMTVVYLVILTFVYFSGKLMDMIFKRKLLAEVNCYVLYGLMGLAIEWFLIGNSPWGNPDADQLGMFSFWATVCFGPRIFLNDRKGVAGVKRGIKMFFFIYAVISTVMGIVLPQPYRLYWIVIFFIVAYDLMNIFYFRYFLILRADEGTR